jgi:hypothetical protein
METPPTVNGSASPVVDTRTENSTEDFNVISDFSNKRKSENKTVNDNLANQELDHIIRDGERGEKFRSHIHRIVLIGIYVTAFLLMIMFIIRVWHFVVPEPWKWLSVEQTHDLERIIFSGVIVSLAGSYFKRYNLLENKK